MSYNSEKMHKYQEINVDISTEYVIRLIPYSGIKIKRFKFYVKC